MKVDNPLVKDAHDIEFEAAARVFHTGLQIFRKSVDGLSLKAAKRLAKLLVEHPFSNVNPALLSQEEVSTFEIGLELLEAKAVMIAETMKKKEKQAEKKSEETKVEETLNG